ncbi:MAG TPA: zinc ribbon domain-containing protein [Methanoregulaceae archaeon]|nr:zinc ribbon domain-containing protein [Methanoregulaceae archaeon]
MAQFCESCGAQLKEGDKFCEQCGAAVAPPVADTPSSQVQPAVPVTGSNPEKNPILSLILSFFVSGLGQVYNGETLKGVALFFGTIIGYLLFVIPGVIVWVYGMYDAYTTAKNMNEGTIPYKETNVMVLIGFVVLIIILVAIVFLAIPEFAY